MQQYYRIRRSRRLIALAAGLHLLIAAMLGAYAEPWPLKLAAVILTLLLGLREVARFGRQSDLSLRFDPAENSILLEQGGQPHFHAKYKVYATRWFAILKLIDETRSRTLILHSERFDSDLLYRQLRYALARGEREHAA